MLFFELRGRRCALPVSAIREVLAAPSVTPVPLAPPAVRGIAPLHGHVVPIVDLGVWLSGAGEPVYRPSDKLLLIEASLPGERAPVRAALAVDRVLRLGTFDEQHSRAAPSGPPFVSATVMDMDGPALLIEPSDAITHVHEALRAVARS